MIDLEALTDRLRRIILALDQLAAAAVADALHPGGDEVHVVAGAAGAAHAPPAHAAEDLLLADLDGDDGVKDDARLLQGLGLGDGAGHPVQDIAVLAVVLGQALVHDADDDLIGHQSAGVDIRLGLQAGGRAVLDGGAENIAGGDGGDAQLPAEDLRLGTLPGAGSA